MKKDLKLKLRENKNNKIRLWTGDLYLKSYNFELIDILDNVSENEFLETIFDIGKFKIISSFDRELIGKELTKELYFSKELKNDRRGNLGLYNSFCYYLKDCWDIKKEINNNKNVIFKCYNKQYYSGEIILKNE